MRSLRTSPHGPYGAELAVSRACVRVAAVAYVDPGNFATNIQAGAQVGYELVWIVLVTDAHAGLSSWYEPSTAQELLRRPDLTLLLIKELFR